MKSFYELLLKVGTNPQLRAWAAKQMINLKSLRSGYKDSFQHSMDKNKIKDIMDPKWIDKEHTAKIAYNLKNKVLDITKAKDKIQWLKDQASLNKARFEGKNFRGWVDDSVKKIGDDMDNFFKKDIAQNKWFNKTLKKSLDGNKKSKLEIDKYFKNIEKIDKEKVVPFWPRKKPYKVHKKADGGRIGFNKGSKGGIGALLTHLYRLSEISPLLASPELVDLIQKIPFKEGGLAGMLGEPRSGYPGGGSATKTNALVKELYDAAGGFDGTGKSFTQFMADVLYEGDYLNKAEGGRIGLAGGGDPRSLLLSWLIKQGPKAWKWMNKPGNNPIDLYKKYLKSVKDRTLKANESGKFTDLPLETLAIGGVGGLIANQFKKKMKGMNEDSVIKHDIFGNERKAQGGRIGLADGDTPSQAWMRDNFYSSGYDDIGVITLDDYINGGQGWRDYMDHGPGKAKGGRIGYDNGGPVSEEEEYELYKQGKEGAGEEYMEFDMWKQFQLFDWGKAEGGRIGFKDGEGIMSRTGDMVDMRNVPYYAGEGLKGLVNSAETLSKLPLAAGELGSKLLREKPNKEMFSEALENITPGSWSENLGLTELVEGMREKRPDDAKTVGGILGLGTEVAVPTGGAFKAGQLLLSKASKAMGKVKDGKTLEKLVDEKLTDSGQSRRDFNLMAATGSLVGALKWLGLGGILKTTTKLKPPDDVVMRLRTWIDDSDEWGEAGPVATAKFGGIFDIESLSTAAQKTLEKISDKGFGWSKRTTQGKKNYLPTYEDVPLEDGSYIADILKKAGHKVRLEHLDDVGGSGVDDILDKFKNDPMYKGTKEGAEHYKKFSEKVKKMTEREKFEYHNSLTDDYGHHYSSDVEDVLDVVWPVKKAEGGRIGYDEGGWTQKDFDKYLEDRKKRDKENRKEDFLDDFEKWKKWKKTEGGTLDWAAEGGRIGLQTGGPPITLQRPMFNDGGLTKTIPPERGPDPQGLPSALYNGIMRPRSY